MADKPSREDYTEEELISVQPVKPLFRCPRCGTDKWAETTTFKTPPTDRLWRAYSHCKVCKKDVSWLIDPDRTVALQSAKMHRPMGWI